MTESVGRYGTPLLFSLCAAQKENEVLDIIRNTPDLDINMVNGDGSTLLMWAIDFGLANVAYELLSRPDINYKRADITGCTALTSMMDSSPMMTSPDVLSLLLNKPDILDNLTAAEKCLIKKILSTSDPVNWL